MWMFGFGLKKPEPQRMAFRVFAIYISSAKFKSLKNIALILKSVIYCFNGIIEKH